MDLLTIILFIFSLAELTMLLQHTDGPFKIFEKFRNYFDIYKIETEEGKIELFSAKDNFFTDLLMCHWCLILEMSIVLLVLYLLIPIIITYIMTILAVAFLGSLTMSLMEKFELT